MDFALVSEWLANESRRYPNSAQQVAADILASLRQFPTLRVKSDIFTFDDGRTQSLLCIHGLLPIMYRASQYNIPVALWITLDYPQHPPMVFVVPTADMLVRPSKHVDPSGRCSTEYIQSWQRKQQGCDIRSLIEELQAHFSSQPPVYAKPKNDGNTYAHRPPPPVPATPPVLPPKPAPPVRTPDPARSPPPAVFSSTPHPASPPRSYSIGTSRHQYQQSPPPGPPPPPPPPPPPSIPLPGITPAPTYRATPPPPPPPFSRPTLPATTASVAPVEPAIIPYTSPPPPPPPRLPLPNLLDEDDPPGSASSPGSGLGPGPASHELTLSDQQLLHQPFQQQHHQQQLHQPSQQQQQQQLPPRPPNPELLSLHTQVHLKLVTQIDALSRSFAQSSDVLRSEQSDLLTGEPAVRDEMARLGAVRDVCRGVVERLGKCVGEAERNLGEMRRKGDPEVDELVCSTTIVHNQLINLVAEDNAIEDTIYHLHRALNAGRIDLERFLRTTRVLAEEQFLKRALIEKIQAGLPVNTVGG